METTLHFNTSINLSQLAKLLREQLPAQARRELVAMIQDDDDEPTKEQILTQLKEDYIALQKGTLKTRPAAEFLAELKTEGYL
ncbi:MAG: hypothetical protein EAZ91_02195 [Cytophagales bacterium]|nr:MAG: hypothetical protein EAZ91_02195 [Cytophagales bacterium]